MTKPTVEEKKARSSALADLVNYVASEMIAEDKPHPFLPCPFCGYKKPLAQHMDKGGWRIVCMNCSATNSASPVESATRKSAELCWNNRPQPTTQRKDS